MQAHKFIIAYLATLVFLSCAGQKGKDVRPNIVMIIGDDHGYPYFGFMGADYVSTPNMDKLAGRGALFTNGYAPANHCRPSLQTLLTGTLPIDYARQEQEIMEREMHKDPYIQLSDEEQKEWRENFQYHAMQYFQTLPGILAEQGYMSFQSGKWWEFHYQHGGFTHGMTEGWTAEERKDFGSWFQLFMGGKGNDLARVTHEPVYEFLSETKGTPFFLWYAPQLPHYPFDAPQKYIDMYKDKDMSESAKLYYANCTWFDDSVGELIAHLKEQGLYENTLFIYYNDNGWEQEPHQEFIHDEMRSHNGGDKGKLSMFDQSFRTPIIFAWEKGIKKGTVHQDLMHAADVPATILDYLGLPLPDDYFGQSYKAVIEAQATGPRSEIIGNINQVRWADDPMGRKLEGYWIRTPEWFFNWNYTDGIKSLFNIENDPSNDWNLLIEYPELSDSLTAKLAAWRMEKGR